MHLMHFASLHIFIAAIVLRTMCIFIAAIVCHNQ
jgi:hypothetical protein